MVNVVLQDNLKIRIEYDDYQYLKDIREYFRRRVENFMFMPAYQSGSWDGTTSMFSWPTKTLPYGLLIDFVRFHKESYPQLGLNIDSDVIDLFKGPKLEVIHNLKLKPYDYQIDCINTLLDKTKGIIRSATASGKSLIISYILKTLIIDNDICKKAIIVVPTKSLVEQFYGDMVDYGLNKSLIGKVYYKHYEWNKPIVISTWQTLSKNHDKLDLYDVVNIDEVHMAKSHELKKILSKSRARYRFGFTGTLHEADLDLWNVKSYLGPVLREYSSGELAEKGYISKCTVNTINMIYKTEYDGNYNDVKEAIFNNHYRLSVIDEISAKLASRSNVLILVGKVEKEGVMLEKFLKSYYSGKYDVVFMSGRDNVDDREYWRKECERRSGGIILMATYGIFQLGINIPSLKYIILAAPFKSKIRVLQSIGRSLRKHVDKEEGSRIFDIVDETKFFADHGLKRLRNYYSEGFEVNEAVLKEGDVVEFDDLIL